MNLENLKDISQIAMGLWWQPAQSTRIAQETFSAVTLLDLPEDASVLRTASALLERSHRAKTLDAVQNPFYRLSGIERFILIGLHRNRWTYEKLSRVLKMEAHKIAEAAWSSRFYLASLANRTMKIPTGSLRSRADCPDYNPLNPWTQLFLDNELSRQRKVFIQNHLLLCNACRKTIARAREFYYIVDELIPRYKNDKDLEKQARALRYLWYRTQAYLHPSVKHTFYLSLENFLRRTDVKVLLAGLIGLLVLYLR